MQKQLPARLRGYAQWLHDDARLLVLVDRDDDDCKVLKQSLESVALAAGLRTRSSAGPQQWQVVNRLAVEELEAWYFGDWAAVQGVYPKVSPSTCQRAAYRSPDAIRGGTWEAFERVLQRQGYFKSGLQKLTAAREIGAKINPKRSHSHSFTLFCDAVAEAFS